MALMFIEKTSFSLDFESMMIILRYAQTRAY